MDAVRRQNQSPGITQVGGNDPCLACGGVPQAQRPIIAGRNRAFAIPQRCQAPHDPGVALEESHRPAGLQVPDYQGAVRLGSQALPAVRQERDLCAAHVRGGAPDFTGELRPPPNLDHLLAAFGQRELLGHQLRPIRPAVPLQFVGPRLKRLGSLSVTVCTTLPSVAPLSPGGRGGPLAPLSPGGRGQG